MPTPGTKIVRPKMKLAGLAPYFGAKRDIAPRIVKQFGPHKAYWELFAGSCAVLLQKPTCIMETVCDLHGDLINLARIVASDDWRVLHERLERTWFVDQLYAESQQRLETETDPMQRAYDYFVTSWQGMSGVAGTKAEKSNFCVRFTLGGGDNATRFKNAVDSIAAWNQRMRRVRILSEDAFDLLDKIPDAEGHLIYADPPYLVKVGKYIHDFSLKDHGRLAEKFRRFKKTRCVISYYAHEILSELYPDWNVLSLDVSKGLVNSQERGEKEKIKAPELLIINGPIL
jgi:DNA adenine methylase